MQQSTTTDTALTMDSSGRQARHVLTEILRRGAQQIPAGATENEVAEYIAAHAHRRGAAGHRLAVRNGHTAAWSIRTGLGPVEVARRTFRSRRGRRVRKLYSAARGGTIQDADARRLSVVV